MKKTFLKTIGTAALAILMLATFESISASAQDNTVDGETASTTKEKSADQNRRGARALEGSWNIQVTRRNCQTGEALVSFPTMSTFMRGGTMQDYGIALA